MFLTSLLFSYDSLYLSLFYGNYERLCNLMIWDWTLWGMGQWRFWLLFTQDDTLLSSTRRYRYYDTNGIFRAMHSR
jgi:hypothetical protein